MHADLSHFIQQHDIEIGNYLRMFRKMECCCFFALGFLSKCMEDDQMSKKF